MIDVNKFKKHIIDLAIQGKLSEQKEEDGSALELFDRIRKEKTELISRGVIRKEKALAPIEKDDIPFEVPSNWGWIRLGDYSQKVTDQVASGSFQALRENVVSLKTPDYALMVKTADFANGFTKNLTYTNKHGYDFLSNSNLFGGELILSNIGSIGKVFIVPKLDIKMTLAPNSVMIRLIDNSMIMYLYYFLLSNQGYKELDAISTGSTMKKINKGDLKTLLLPIPPLQEQLRIVNKLNEIFAELDNVEKNQNKLLILQDGLRKKVLNLAIRGKLTEQLIDDGTADDLLRQISLKRLSLVKEGKIRKERPLDVVDEADNPYDIPNNWKWVKLGDAYFVVMGQSPSSENVSANRDGVEFHQGKIFFTDYLLKDSNIRTAEVTKIAPKNSILLCVRAPVGKINFVDREICIGRGLCAINSYGLASIDYLYLLLETMESYFCDKANGSTFSAISVDVVKNALIPLPPLKEQERIVKKVKEILSYCKLIA